MKFILKYITGFGAFALFMGVAMATLVAQTGDENGCLSAGCHADLAGYKTIHAPAAEDCASCHEWNGNKHPASAGAEFPLMSEVPELCYACHDEPSPDKNIHPPIESGECLTCHSPHGSNNASLLLSEEVGELCNACHDLETESSHSIHAPVAANECQLCHDPHESQYSALLKKEIPDLCVECHEERVSDLNLKNTHYPIRFCTSCHAPHSSANETLLTSAMPDLCYECHEKPPENVNIHLPVEMGECSACHAPHGSKYASMLKADTLGVLCENCHDLEIGKKDVVHAPVDEKSCEMCHEAHYSKVSSMLKNEPPNLCFECHDDQKEELNFKTVHAPFEDCLSCHGPHKGASQYLLAAGFPDFCFECHSDFQTEIEEKKVVHQIIREDGACVSCHKPHASRGSELLIEEQPKLCLDCHNKEITVGDRTIDNIKAKIDNAEVVHAPIEGDGCTICHQPHFSDQGYLLKASFPAGNYAPGDQASFVLCFDCHDSKLLTREKSYLATNFRNGTQNLHYLHIKQEKGRSCINCHDVHGAKNEHLIADAVHFGKWKMPLKFKPLDNGGSCTPGCHGEKKYVR